ncbi:MAG: hypothetical protein EXR70_04765 [Deltaproteobacteria bacterium]|nr:hypothetical protein [Deltaproteobacteria bacterium]
MKPFVIYTALVLAIIFLAGALVAIIEVLQEPNLLANPKLKPALGFLVSGGMFLGIGLRGWRGRRKIAATSNQSI